VKLEAQDLAGTEVWASPPVAQRSDGLARRAAVSHVARRTGAVTQPRLRRWAAVLTAATCVLSWTDSAERKRMATRTATD
jgi:hypothetical protein